MSTQIMESSASLCRICLQTGAAIPLFESEGNDQQDTTSAKYELIKYLKEKIENIEGYPKNICNLCYTTLNTLNDLSEKLIRSNSILESNFKVSVKQEFIDCNTNATQPEKGIEICCDNIKQEICDDESSLERYDNPSTLEICNESIKLEKYNDTDKTTLALCNKVKLEICEDKSSMESSDSESQFEISGERIKLENNDDTDKKTLEIEIEKFEDASTVGIKDKIDILKLQKYNEITLIKLEKHDNEYDQKKTVETHDNKNKVDVNADTNKPFIEVVVPSLAFNKESKERHEGELKNKTTNRNVCQNTNRASNTNRIASSIIEGKFLWSGGKWCIKSSNRQRERQVMPSHSKIKQKKTQKLLSVHTCYICEKSCESKEDLKCHMFTHKDLHEKRKVICPTCCQEYSSQYNLMRHIKRIHSENGREFACPICNKLFAFEGERNTHYKHTHIEKRKSKLHSCKECDKTYTSAKPLLIHVRAVHTGERPAVCSMCGAAFYHEDYLKQHMRLHTGETPFKCPVCEQGYAQLSNMKSHIRVHRISELDPELYLKIRPNYLKLMKQ